MLVRPPELGEGREEPIGAFANRPTGGGGGSADPSCKFGLEVDAASGDAAGACAEKVGGANPR